MVLCSVGVDLGGSLGGCVGGFGGWGWVRIGEGLYCRAVTIFGARCWGQRQSEGWGLVVVAPPGVV